MPGGSGKKSERNRRKEHYEVSMDRRVPDGKTGRDKRSAGRLELDPVSYRRKDVCRDMSG